MGLLKLAEKHTSQKLESACEKALQYSASPSYKSIKNLLVNLKASQEPVKEDTSRKVNSYGITRGAGYYGGNRQ